MVFKELDISSYLYNISQLFKKRHFCGWGRKKTGLFAQYCFERFGGTLTLHEDGFIRSIGLGVEGSPSFSMVEDDAGIYYDATTPSKLENILNTYDFTSDRKLMGDAKRAIAQILKYHISKYNNATNIESSMFPADESRVLIIAQTEGDASLKYGMSDRYTTEDMINAALKENPDATVYLKVHPDVLKGKKKSDIDIGSVKGKCIVIDQDANPISLLKYFDKVYTKTSGMGFEALLAGCECVCFGMPFYAGWGITTDKVKNQRRYRKLSVEEVFAAAYILYTRYYDPYTKRELDIFGVIELIVKFRKNHKAYLFGFSLWKRIFISIKPFFTEYRSKDIHFINPILSTHLKAALKKGLNGDAHLYFWGRKNFPEVEAYAQAHTIKIQRVEDGFIRSIALGSDLTQPYSLIVDKEGIYFDPARPSDLEEILNTYDFETDARLLDRAKVLKAQIIRNGISKYNADPDIRLDFSHTGKRVALVVGQVEDDASIQYGAEGMTNVTLLQKVKENYPDRYVVFKPHPDVLSGNRVGDVPKEEALNYCDEVIDDVSMASVLKAVDEVHTITSLTGFEALLYEKEVYTYGMPFYAGWGLTADNRKCERRKRKLTVDELIAAVYLLYPRYISPKTKQRCEAEEVIFELKEQKTLLENSWIARVKFKSRSYFGRFSQKLFS